MTNPNRVRDHREPGHFWADNEIIDNYLPTIGAYGFAVYMLLTRLANHKTGQCDPSVTAIAKTLGVSPPTAKKGLDALKKAGLITIISRPRVEEGRKVNDTNVYTLLAIPKSKGTQGDLVPNIVGEGVPKEITKGTQGDLVGVPKDVGSNNKEEESKERGGVGEHDKSPSKSAPAPIFEKLAEVCRIPIALASQKQRKELGTAASKLHQHGATLDQLDRFAVWWESDSNWRSKKARQEQRKPEAPRPIEVCEEWGNALGSPIRKAPANGTGPPPTTRPVDALPAAEAMRRVLAARKTGQT